MSFDILTFGEALVEIMRTAIDQPLDQPAGFTGPYPSGAPFIFAAQAARLGARVATVGAVGDDPFGDCLINQLNTDGIDHRFVQKLDTHATGVAFVAYNGDGSRDFVFHIKDAAAGQLHPDMLDESLFEALKCLHLMGSTLSIHQASLQTGLRAVELASKQGAKISFDPNLRPQLMPIEEAKTAFAPILKAADVIIPTAEEITLLTDTATVNDAVVFLLADGPPERQIIVTEGEAGCTLYSRHTPQGVQIPGFAVDEIDPTGAGDCFDAGFLVRWLGGHSPHEAARWANACGALAVTVQGPMAGARRSDEIEAFLKARI